MKVTLLSAGLLCLFTQAMALDHNHDWERSAYSHYRHLQPVQNPVAQRYQPALREKMSGWNISFDKLSGLPLEMFGKPLALSGTTARQKAEAFVQQYLAPFGITGQQLVLRRNTSNDKALFVDYGQQIDGREVVFSRLGFRFSKNAELVRVQSKVFAVPQQKLSPALSGTEALQAAEAGLDGLTLSDANTAPDWVWFPLPTAAGYELRPAYAFIINGSNEAGSLPVKLRGYVDAINGDVLYRSNEVKESFDVTVKGTVYKANPTVAASDEVLPDMLVTSGSVSGYTDPLGVFSDNTLGAPVTVNFALQGKWSVVANSGAPGSTPAFSKNIATTGSTYLFPDTGASSSRHVNAYYHVTRIHDFMKGFFPNFTGLDIPLPTNIDAPGNCNAFYTSSTINFLTAGSGCNSFALCGDIVYHEYGHGISDLFYRANGVQWGMNNGALNEGNSDIWGIGISRDPVLGRGSMQNGGIIRRYDLAPKVYPQDIQGEVHADGEIIAGAWWDVATNTGSVDTMSKLFTATYFDVPDGPSGTEGDVYRSVLISALQNDDDDNDITNGTRNFTAIVAAFARHGIFLLGDASFNHTEIDHQPQGQDITVETKLNVNFPDLLGGVSLKYRVRPATTWDSIGMTKLSDSLYSAVIPAQAKGAMVDYYFTVNDNTNTPNLFFPRGYYPQMVAAESNIPYQFGVGIIPVKVNNFETDPTADGWLIGNLPGDDATAGKWIWDVPVGSYLNSAQGQIPVQPGYDHTTPAGTGKCLVTGNAASPSSFPGSADVDQGLTTAMSPAMDLTGYANPVIEYYRWYSNDMGGNPGNDAWEVQMSANNGNAWRFVDRTFKADASWRRRIFAVREYFTPTANMKIRFRASDMNISNLPQQGQSTVEAAVDDLYIYDTEPPATGLDNTTLIRETRVFPNPANEVLHITVPEALKTVTIRVFNISGQEVSSTRANGGSPISISTANLAAGTYSVMIEAEKAMHVTKINVVHP
jgi:hypothetical protein